MPRPLVPLLLAAALLAPGGAVAAAPRTAPQPTVVVAVADTGVNPYHEVFRRPKNTQHPCTYVKGFSCAIPALRLSIGKYQDYREALVRDRDVWETVEPHQWYWIPGTNIVGAVCDREYSSPRDVRTPENEDDPSTWRYCILDNDGHGTGTASAVLSEAPDALLLVHEGNAGAYDLATMPVTADVQTHSWAAPAPLPLQAGDPVLGDAAICGGAERRKETLYFLAAGNEAPFPTWLDCERKNPDVHVVGGAYPGRWTPFSWSMYDYASWFCRPVAVHAATKGQETACGTSFASPTAAGAAAAALLTVRRHDRYTGRNTRTQVSRTVSRAAFEEALQRAASYAPKAKFDQPGPATAVPVPEDSAHLFWGYGWLDSTVTGAIVSCALRRACPTKSADAQSWNEQRQQLREAQGVNAPVAPQRDAGSNRDAGTDRATAVPVVPGRTYDSRIEPHGYAGDADDWYTLKLRAGQRVTVTTAGYVHPSVPVDVTPASGCWFLLDARNREVGAPRGRLPMRYVACDSSGPNTPPTNVRVPATGAYVLVYTSHNGVPHDYRFSVAAR
ncbi:MAG TPA: S8 family serine peptidase [Frankiaceae bacterium]|nr:S8 family serine peptidase [Frankiaceae bacterium]